MSRYRVEIEPLAAQEFTASLGESTLSIAMQWMERLQVFRVDIRTAQGQALTLGRYLLPGVDLLDQLYPPSDVKYGSLVLEGAQPTPANLGIDNVLVWNDG